MGVRSHHPPPLPPQQDFPTKTNTFIYACLGLTAAYRVLRTSRRQSLNLVSSAEHVLAYFFTRARKCGVRWYCSAGANSFETGFSVSRRIQVVVVVVVIVFLVVVAVVVVVVVVIVFLVVVAVVVLGSHETHSDPGSGITNGLGI